MSIQPVAIITAAGQGMGAAIAHSLHERGYRLALMSPSGSAKALAESLGHLGRNGSVTEAGDVDALVEATLEAYGRIDALVNNTGHPPKGPLLELGPAEWQTGFDLVLQSAIQASQRVIPSMQSQGGGAIVNISAFGAVEPSLAFPISSALRAALSAYTKLLSDECAPHNIRVNSVLPGMIDSYPESPATVAQIPLGRYGRVREIGETVAFLLSEEAGFITGQNWRVDGGQTRSL